MTYKRRKNKMNANEFAKQLEEKLDCVVLHTKVRDEDNDDEMFIVLSPSARRVKMTFVVDLMENFVYNLDIQGTSYYELDKYLKILKDY
jgi:hypothetical protein